MIGKMFRTKTRIVMLIVSLSMLAVTAHKMVAHAFPGSGFAITKSDGLIKGLPLGVEFNIQM